MIVTVVFVMGQKLTFVLVDYFHIIIMSLNHVLAPKRQTFVSFIISLQTATVINYDIKNYWHYSHTLTARNVFELIGVLAENI